MGWNEVAFIVYNENRQINCDGCGVCIKNCPQSAIQLEILEIK